MRTMLHSTRNDLREKTRRAMVVLLNQHLADVLDLGLQARQAHWNVKGPSFIALHELFDKVAGELAEMADELAERAVALGGIATGTLQTVSRHSRLKAYPLDLASGREHLSALSSALADFGRHARSAISVADGADDADTADLFTGVSRQMDKLLWLVEAHVQAKE